MGYSITPAVREQRRQAGTRHGAQSAAQLAPLVVSMKKSLLQRMGIRQRDLSWSSRELLDIYCCSRAKVTAIDRWLETNPMIDQDGNVGGAMKLYVAALNTSVRTLEASRSVIAAQAREDDRFGRALDALAAEGAKVRAGNGSGE